MNAQLPKQWIRLAAVAGAVLTAHVTLAAEPLKIFILAGQSNMVGHARAHTIATLYASDKPRDQELRSLVFNNASGVSLKSLEEQLARGRNLDALTGGISNEKIKALNEGPEKKALEAEVKKRKGTHEAYKQRVAAACAVSQRVYISSIADGNRRSGKLGVGYGASKETIGPEYGLGLSLARQIDGPVLLIKPSWGGKSLHYNFRPPSAGPYTLSDKEKASDKADEIKQNAGLNYRMMHESIRKVLADPGSHHPDYEAKAGYEIAGFVWFQGFNDQFSPAFRDNYKDNMIAFIHDVRAAYDVPRMPFIIGVLGTGVTAEKVAENPVSVAQREAARQLGTKNGVASVESYTVYSLYSNRVFQKGWPEHFHEWDTVGSDRPYHYLGSGAFFVRLGAAFADSLVNLMTN